MSDPVIITIDNAQDVLASATAISYSCHVRNWETTYSSHIPDLAGCRERLLARAGSAVLDDGSTGPAPYAECVAKAADGSTTRIMHWGTDPEDAP